MQTKHHARRQLDAVVSSLKAELTQQRRARNRATKRGDVKNMGTARV